MRHLEEMTKKMKTLKYGRPFLYYSLPLSNNIILYAIDYISKNPPREKGIEKNYASEVGVNLKIQE